MLPTLFTIPFTTRNVTSTQTDTHIHTPTIESHFNNKNKEIYSNCHEGEGKIEFIVKKKLQKKKEEKQYMCHTPKPVH